MLVALVGGIMHNLLSNASMESGTCVQKFESRDQNFKSEKGFF
jgi:hypothetical protein